MSAQPGHREKPRAVLVFSWTFLVVLGCLFPLQKNLPVAVVALVTGVLTACRCDYSLLVQGDATSKGPSSAGCLGSHSDLGSSSLLCLSLEKEKTELFFHPPHPSTSAPFCPGRMEAEETRAGPISFLRQAGFTSDLQSGRLLIDQSLRVPGWNSARLNCQWKNLVFFLYC